MKYEKVFLDIMNRVIELEEKVKKLEQLNDNLEAKTKKNKSFTRRDVRKYVLDKLKKENRPELFNFNIATREEGSGIRFEYKLESKPSDSYPIAFKFYSSNVTSNINNRDGINRVWFSVKKEDIDQIMIAEENYRANKLAKAYVSGIIFFVIDEENDEELILIIPGINVAKFIGEKGYDTYDKNNNYHFYFEKTPDGRILETRNDKPNGIDVTKYADDYSILKKFYIEKRKELK